MSDVLHVVLADGEPRIATTVKRLLRALPVVVVDFDDPRSAVAYVSTLNAPADVVWTDLAFREGAVGLTILELASRRVPRPELFLVTSAAIPEPRLPAGARLFDRVDLRAVVAEIEQILRRLR